MPFVVVEIKEIEAANNSGLQVLKVETRENQSKEEWTQIVRSSPRDAPMTHDDIILYSLTHRRFFT